MNKLPEDILRIIIELARGKYDSFYVDVRSVCHLWRRLAGDKRIARPLYAATYVRMDTMEFNAVKESEVGFFVEYDDLSFDVSGMSDEIRYNPDDISEWVEPIWCEVDDNLCDKGLCTLMVDLGVKTIIQMTEKIAQLDSVRLFRIVTGYLSGIPEYTGVNKNAIIYACMLEVDIITSFLQCSVKEGSIRVAQKTIEYITYLIPYVCDNQYKPYEEGCRCEFSCSRGFGDKLADCVVQCIETAIESDQLELAKDLYALTKICTHEDCMQYWMDESLSKSQYLYRIQGLSI